MEEVSIFEIKKQADNMISAGAKWHFHILTPRCMFNGRPQYAFVLENTSEGIVFVHYSIQPQKELGEELVRKLHRDKNIEKAEGEKVDLTDAEKKLVEHAKKLNEENKDWHHHMLFPGCTFNEARDKWSFVFEGEDANDIHELSYKKEPNHLLQQIEPLFYKQK